MSRTLCLAFLLAFSANTVLFAEKPASFSIGQFEIIPFEESSSQANTRLLIGITEDEIKEVVPDGKIPSSVNVFLVKSGKRNILVDTGFGRNNLNNLKAAGLKPEDIDVILMTHMHGDHYGGLVADGKAVFPKAVLYIAKIENDFWADDANPRGAGVRAALAPYAERLNTFEFTEKDNERSPELVEGICGVATFGHTPGHTAFLLESEGKSLLIIADLVHAAAVQFPRPDVAIQYDNDAKMAVKTREKILKLVAEEKIPIAGMHILFPGIGTVEKLEKGYKFVPMK